MTFRLVGAMLLLILWMNPAGARECDFSDREMVEARLISNEAFLAAGRGAVAIGEGQCSRSTNRCERYLLISQCETVTYAHPGSDALNPLSVVLLNSDRDCEGASCADSFLSAAMLFEPDQRYRAEVEFIRNDSSRWTSTELVKTFGGYKQAISRPQSIVEILTLITADNSKLRDLVSAGVLWHSSFVAKHGWFGRLVLTWAMRDRVLWSSDVERCGADCAIKLFLIKFEEAQGEPSSLLRISGNMAGREGMLLRTHADTDEPSYNRTVEFRFANR